ncbi:MAG: MFS transporter [Chloroflexi bacterium]|nr:MFS transporter [Chloroflexota bacterium]
MLGRPRSVHLERLGYAVYDFGLSGLWQSLFIVLLPVLILGLVPEESKNTRLGELRVISQAVAVVVQPLAGLLSDRRPLPGGRRLPYMAVGTALALAVLPWVGLAGSFLVLVVAICALQVATNLGLGPFNALIPDNLSWEGRGGASSLRALVQAVGASLSIVLVGLLAGRYSSTGDRGWIWAAIAFLGAGMLLSLVVTFAIVRERRPGQLPASSSSGDLSSPPRASEWPLGFGRFLVSRFCFSFSMGVMGTYGLFYLRDRVGLDNPAQAIAVVAVLAGGIAAAFTYPLGLLSNRIGRRPLLAAAGALGIVATAIVLGARTFWHVAAVGALAGAAMALYIGPNWAMATDLVPRRRAGLYLGFTTLASALGPMLAGLGGRGVDFLNGRAPGLGYTVMVLLSGVLLGLGSLLLFPRQRHKGPRRSGS